MGRAPWVFRGAWAVLPFVSGPALADALDGASRPVQVVASVGLWLGWAAVLAASLVPRASTLTMLRLAAPCPLAAACGRGRRRRRSRRRRRARCRRRRLRRSALLPSLADAFVDGSSYGAERRFALRTPIVTVGDPGHRGVGARGRRAGRGAALLARGGEPGSPAARSSVVAVAGVRLGVPALHRLSRRWLVFVPAGFVVHDHVALPEPVLLRRPSVRRLGPAPADAVEAGAARPHPRARSGLAVEVGLGEPVDLPRASDAARLLRHAAAAGRGAGRGPSAWLPGGDGGADDLVAVVEHDELAGRHPRRGCEPPDRGAGDVRRESPRRGRCTGRRTGPGVTSPVHGPTAVSPVSRSTSSPTVTMAPPTSTSTT